MGTLLRIAWRNLGRNLRRTVITASTIAFGVALCVATYGLTDGLNAQLIHSATKLDLGHVQIHHPEYPKRRLMRYTLEDGEALMAAASEVKAVTGATPRVYAWALLSHTGTSTGVELVGVDPAREPAVTELFESLEDGEPLPVAATPWPQGREMTAAERAWDEKETERATDAALDELDALAPLDGGAEPAPGTPAPGSEAAPAKRAAGAGALLRELSPPPEFPPPILLGDKLATAVGVKRGDFVYALSGSVDGLSVEERFEVVGIFHTGTASLDRTRAYVHLADLQRFVRLGARFHEVALSVERPVEAGVAAAGIAAMSVAEGKLVRSWDRVRPMLKRMLDLNDASVGVMLVIVFLVAALGVLNTMVMAIFERTRELGVIIALGLRPGQVLRLVIYETVLLTIAGGIVGTVAGLAMDGYLMWYGWDLSSMTGGVSLGGVGVDPVLRAAITAKGLVIPLLAMSIVGFLASFYPARRASKLEPTEAMRET